MMNHGDLALRSEANLRVNRPAGRATSLDQEKRTADAMAAQALRVDRTAITRFAAVLTVLLIAYILVGSPNETDWGFVNTLCPLVLCVAGLWTCYKIIIGNPNTIWTPIPWLTLAAAVYYGFGPLIYIFGPEQAIANMDTYWHVGTVDLWRTNLLNTVGILTICVSFLAMDRWLDDGRSYLRISLPTPKESDDFARLAAFVFLGIGLPLRYLLVLPYTFGQFDFTLPGIIFSMNCLVSLATFMLAYLGLRHGGLWSLGFWFLFVSELISNFITYSKLSLLLVFIMTALGRFQARRNIKELCFAGATVFCFYALVLSPLVTWGRQQLLNNETGEVGSASVGLRLSVAARGFELWSQGALDSQSGEAGGSWIRLCSCNQQTAAMHFYDSGVAGDSFAYALYAWIPRFIWSDKPVVNLGEEFTILVQGHGGNCTGPGTVAEAYWNGGWLLVILASGYLGALFAWLTRTGLRTMVYSQWLLLPCAFMGIFMGMRIDGWYAPTYIIGLLTYLAYYLTIRLALGGKVQAG